MKRRTFIKASSLVSTPLLIGGIPVSSISKSAITNFINNDDDRVLVLIQLNGGNDGLATIIPRDQQDGLVAVRQNIVIPESSILPITDTVGLHPNMEGIKTIYDEGKMNIIQSVGYPNQNRSHFRSLDIWNTGSHADEFLDTGWLGRFLDSQYPNYPGDYPNENYPDPFAITIGSGISETCEGMGGNFSLAIANPENLTQLASPQNNELAEGCYGTRLDFLTKAIEQTNAYGEVITLANDLGNNLSSKYPDGNELAERLRIVARLISGGLQTKIYIVSIGGFDTHANQTVDGSPTTGIHANLLQTLSDAICAFQEDLSLLGLEERVLGMTYSEFGRRIRSNFSLGTDHGTAAPLMVFGSCVNSGILGENPVVSEDVSNNEGVPMQFDFRSVYGSILMDWFEVDEEVVKNLLFDDFQHLQIVKACATTSIDDPVEANLELTAYPNPFNNNTNLEFSSPGEWIKVSVFDTIGNEIKVLTNQFFAEGKYTIKLEGHDLPSGAYYYRMQTKTSQRTGRLVKI